MTAWLLVPAVALAVLETVAAGFRRPWDDRGINRVLPGPVGAGARVAFGVLAAAAVHHYGRGAPAAAASAAAAWLAVIASDCDLASRKIPREACWGAYAVGAGCAAVGAGPAGWESLGLALLVAYLPMMLASRLSRGGMGYGDVRLVVASCLCFAWWSGAYPVMLGIVLGCVLQAVFGHLAVRVIRGRASKDASGKRRRFLPFAPALGAGTAVAVALALAGGQSACADLAAFASCR